MKNIRISEAQLNDLKVSGHCVPRVEKTGDVIKLSPGKDYTVNNVVVVRCTQNYPTHIKINS